MIEGNGNLPACWRRVRLGDVCQVIPGRHIIETAHNRLAQGVPYITGPSDFGDIQATPTRWTETPDVMCAPADTLVTVKGAGVGKINLAPSEPACIGRQLMAMRAIPHHADPSFIFLALNAFKKLITEKATGATVPGVVIDDLVALPLLLPPLEEQQRIAAGLRE